MGREMQRGFPAHTGAQDVGNPDPGGRDMFREGYKSPVEAISEDVPRTFDAVGEAVTWGFSKLKIRVASSHWNVVFSAEWFARGRARPGVGRGRCISVPINFFNAP
jgi:hypothetical protein